MTLYEWAKEIHENAVKHGWWDEPRSFGEIVALCHAELSEALEEYRDGNPMVYYNCNGGRICVDYRQDENVSCGSRVYDPDEPGHCHALNRKPEGIATEMIDCVIRILDWCGKEGIDVDEIMRIKHEYNKTRPYRHGGKKI